MHSPLFPAARLPIHGDADLSQSRQRVRQATADLGSRRVQQTELVTAAGEPARNTLAHGAVDTWR